MIQSLNIPAPIGGINTISSGHGMPPTDCIYLFNMLSAEYGLRSRLGYVEQVTGMVGIDDDKVRSTIAFAGSNKSQTTDRVFQATQKGIYDVTSSGMIASGNWASATPYAVGDLVLNDSGRTYICTTAGTSAGSGGPTGVLTGITDNTVVWNFEIAANLLVTFGTQSGDAGIGIDCITSILAGRFMVYCDEVNGAYLYSETDTAWSRIAKRVAWTAVTAYTAGDIRCNSSNAYLCITSGTSAGSGGPTTTSSDITDGTAHWKYLGTQEAKTIVASADDIANGIVADPANFVFCVVFKNRLWFVEKDSTRAWYMDIGAIFGTATSFDFGQRMKSGGLLVGLYNWSYDGGSGMDTQLVGISSAGDIVIYQGTDPSSANTFGLKGTWYVGGVPSGRRIATDYGGDLLILSLLGAIPLSRLVVGKDSADKSQYETYKISNLFNFYASTYGSQFGWSIFVQPQDNALVITVPGVNQTNSTVQLVMSFSTKSWSQYRDLPIMSAGILRGIVYFGTDDGRCCINTGYVDNVPLTDSTEYTAVDYSFLSSYQNLGNGNQKRVQLIRPTLLSDGANPNFQIIAKYGFDLTEPVATTFGQASPSNGSVWGTAVWGVDTWSAEIDYDSTQNMYGTAGVGREMAIAGRGKANCRTIFAGALIYFDIGGQL